MDSKKADYGYNGNCITIHICFKPTCFTPQIYTILRVKYISIIKKKEKESSKVIDDITNVCTEDLYAHTQRHRTKSNGKKINQNSNSGHLR